MDEQRKYAILFAATILAARNLNDPGIKPWGMECCPTRRRSGVALLPLPLPHSSVVMNQRSGLFPSYFGESTELCAPLKIRRLHESRLCGLHCFAGTRER